MLHKLFEALEEKEKYQRLETLFKEQLPAKFNVKSVNFCEGSYDEFQDADVRIRFASGATLYFKDGEVFWAGMSFADFDNEASNPAIRSYTFAPYDDATLDGALANPVETVHKALVYFANIAMTHRKFMADRQMKYFKQTGDKSFLEPELRKFKTIITAIKGCYK